MKRPKVLIAEGGDHFKCIENTCHLLNKTCDLTFYFSETKYGGSELMFPSQKTAKVIKNPLHSVFYYFNLIVLGRRFDYINISTGPEGGHYSEIFPVICFYICSLLYGSKMILTIRNIPPWLETTGGLLCYMRRKSLERIKRFVFETATLRNCFIRHAKLDGVLCGVCYDRYSDLLRLKGSESLPLGARKVRVGLLGTLNGDRRDYALILNALKAMSVEERSNLEFVTLGGCVGAQSRRIADDLSAVVLVDCKDGWLSEAEFEERGASCDVLISPLIAERLSMLKGSGSFGDAVYLRKKIVIPLAVDPEREFAEIAIYYDGLSDIIAVLKDIGPLISATVSGEFYEKFSTKMVLKTLVSDLKIPCSNAAR